MGHVGKQSNNTEKSKIEKVKKVFTDLEEFELSPKIESRHRKMSLTVTKQYQMERKYSKKGFVHQRTIGNEYETSKWWYDNDDDDVVDDDVTTKSDSVNFEKCKIRRKLSFPSCRDGSYVKTDVKYTRKKDATLLALIFKKQTSFDVKKDGGEMEKSKDNNNKYMKIPDFSFSSNEIASSGDGGDGDGSGDMVGQETTGRRVNRDEINGVVLISGNVSSDKTGSFVTNNIININGPDNQMGSKSKKMSRSCGQVEIIPYDPAAQENFLRATMSIFLAVSPPSSKIQVMIN